MNKTGVTCPKCKGDGRLPRVAAEDGAEADPDLHPIVSREPKTCDGCGGSGQVNLTPAQLKARADSSTASYVSEA